MQPTKKVSLGKNFPQDDCFWRVDWVDGVLSKHAEKEPEITVFLTKIKAGNGNKIYPLQPDSIYKTIIAPATRAKAMIGIGHQSLVNIGSVWKNGINFSHAYDYARFDLDLDTSQAIPITFQHKNALGKRVLTAYQYPTGSAAYETIKNSTLIAIPYKGDDCGFMIPASEIIRFYYLISTPMSKALYYGKFDKLVREGETMYAATSRYVEFTLNWGVSGFDVPIIARYLSSEIMQERVSEIFSWLQVNSINKMEQKSTTTFFPFDGETHLTFEGTLVRGDDGKQRILCTRLISCSGPINFDEVIASTMISDGGAEDFKTEQNSLPWYWSFPSYQSENDIDLDEEPSKKHLTTFFVKIEDRFTKLVNKSITIGKIIYQSEKKKKIRYEISNAQRKISTSNGTCGNSNTRKANFVIGVDSDKVDSPIFPRLQSFIDALNHLRSKGMDVGTIEVTLPKKLEGQRGYKVVQTTNIGGEVAVGCFKVGKIKNAWVTIDVDGNPKPRGMMIARVKYQSKLIYLFELEQYIDATNNNIENFSILIQYKADFSAITNDELYNFVLNCGVVKKWAKMSVEDAIYLKRARVNHAGSVKERVLSVIQEACS